MKCLKIHCDGGARGNPGPAASAFVVYDEQNSPSYSESMYLGTSTNNDAEYKAVLLAANYLQNLTPAPECVNFFLDSQLVVQQLRGVFKIKNENLKLIANQVRQKLSPFKTTFHYIPREQNQDADKMVNACLDENVNG